MAQVAILPATPGILARLRPLVEVPPNLALGRWVEPPVYNNAPEVMHLPFPTLMHHHVLHIPIVVILALIPAQEDSVVARVRCVLRDLGLLWEVAQHQRTPATIRQRCLSATRLESDAHRARLYTEAVAHLLAMPGL